MNSSPCSMRPAAAPAPSSGTGAPAEAETGTPAPLMPSFEHSLRRRAGERLGALPEEPEETAESVQTPATPDTHAQGFDTPTPPDAAAVFGPPPHRPPPSTPPKEERPRVGVEDISAPAPTLATPALPAPQGLAPAPRSAPASEQTPLATLQALAQATPALPRQWLLELNPQALQGGLLLQAERQVAAAGAPAWSLNLHTAPGSPATQQQRERLAARLRGGGVRLQGLTLHERPLEQGSGDE